MKLFDSFWLLFSGLLSRLALAAMFYSSSFKVVVWCSAPWLRTPATERKVKNRITADVNNEMEPHEDIRLIWAADYCHDTLSDTARGGGGGNTSTKRHLRQAKHPHMRKDTWKIGQRGGKNQELIALKNRFHPDGRREEECNVLCTNFTQLGGGFPTCQ